MKRLDFFKRRPGLDLAAFRAEVQAVYRACPCVLHFTHDTGYRAHEPDLDCVAELGPDFAHIADGDVFEFIDEPTWGSLMAEEVVIVDGVPGPEPITMFAFLRRLPGTDPAAFRAYWRGHHGPIAARVPGLRRYVQNHVVPRGTDVSVPDGVAQTWFDDLDTMRASARSEELTRTRADEPNFMISGRLRFVVCEPMVLNGGV